MDKVISSAPQLAGLIPYDPKYLPAELYMSANENPSDVDGQIRRKIEKAVRQVPFNRYPDPLANELRDIIADANGLDRSWVLVGNGGDELLFDTALAWGGPGRSYLDFPPTFSVYSANARLTNTGIVSVGRGGAPDFAIDRDLAISALQDPANNVAFTIIASPNNPTGLMADQSLILDILAATDALVMVDEAYFEFSRMSVRPYLEQNKNLVILRTFSKAFSLAGLRLGYILAHPEVIDEYKKVRQPYSVDAFSQAAGRVVYESRSEFVPAIESIIEERDRLQTVMATVPGVRPMPSDSNWILFHINDAEEAWQFMYDHGVLVRDLSNAPMLEGMLRVTVGTPGQNDRFLAVLKEFALKRRD